MSRSSSSSIAAAHSAAWERSSRVAGGGPSAASAARAAPGSGSGPGTNFRAGRPGRRVEISAARGIELREDVVEEEKRRDTAALGDQFALGEEEREDREPLLALRAEAPQVTRLGADHDVVEVRAGTGDAAVEIAVEALLEES